MHVYMYRTHVYVVYMYMYMYIWEAFNGQCVALALCLFFKNGKQFPSPQFTQIVHHMYMYMYVYSNGL